jgi:integrase
VNERMLTDAWARAREKAVKNCPEVEGLLLRHMRRRAAQLAGSLQEAQQLLQHGSAATTQRHYRPGEKLRPVR